MSRYFTSLLHFGFALKQLWRRLDPALKLWIYWITIPEIIFLIMLFILCH